MRNAKWYSAIGHQHGLIRTMLKEAFTYLGDMRLEPKRRQEEVDGRLKKVARACGSIEQMLDPKDVPQWLPDLRAVCDSYLKDHDGSRVLMVMHRMGEAEGFSWKAHLDAPPIGFDFDALFEKYRKEGNLDLALGELVGCIQAVIEEGGKDLRQKAIEDLTVILETARGLQGQSRTSIESALQVIWSFFKLVFFAVNPELATLHKMLDLVGEVGAAILKADDELRRVDEKVKRDVGARFVSGQVKALTYSSEGSILPDSAQGRLDATA